MWVEARDSPDFFADLPPAPESRADRRAVASHEQQIGGHDVEDMRSHIAPLRSADRGPS